MIMSSNLRDDFRVLHALEQDHHEMDARNEIAKGAIIKAIKERIRNTLKEQLNTDNIDWHYPDYDTRWCKIIYEGLPEDWYEIPEDWYEEPEVTRESAIKEYIDDEWCHWYNPYNDGRDCTGVWFTRHIYVFPLPALEKTVVYHIQGCDV